jgi:serine/threonine protein kinase
MPAPTLFSFGIVMYEMATAAIPFRGETSGVIFDAILNRAPVAPVRLNPTLPPKLEDIINRALEKDRELRYQHASDMKSELLRLKRDLESGRTSAVSAFSQPLQGGSSCSGSLARNRSRRRPCAGVVRRDRTGLARDGAPGHRRADQHAG